MPQPSIVRHHPVAVVGLVASLALIAGCGGDAVVTRSSGSGSGSQTSAPIGPMTAKDVAAGRLPKGFRLGDPVDEAIWRPVSPERSEKVPGFKRLAHQPTEGIYRIEAAGHPKDGAASAKATVVQVIFPDPDQLPVADFCARTGVQAGAAVGVMALPVSRDRMRMSQSHLAALRDPGVLVATDRRGTWLVLRNGAVDSVIISSDLAGLDLVEGRLLSAEAAALRAALESGDPGAVDAAFWSRHAGLAGGEAIDAAWEAQRPRYEELVAARLVVDQAHDAPILAVLAERQAALRVLMTSGPESARLAGWCSETTAIQGIARTLRLPRAPDDGQALLVAEAARRTALQRNAGEDLLWEAVGAQKELRDPTVLAALAGHVAAVEAPSATYASAHAAFAALKAGGITRPDAFAWHGALAVAAERDAAAMDTAGRPGAAHWLRHIANDLRRHYTLNNLSVEHEPKSVLAFAAQLDHLPAAPLAARASWLIQAKGDIPHADRDSWFRTTYLQDLMDATAAGLRAGADALEERGLVVTATVWRLQADSLTPQWAAAPVPVHALAEPVRDGEDGRWPTLRALRPYLVEILPVPDAATAYGTRLAELLAEGPRLEWPLVALFQLTVEPQPVVTGQAGAHLHVVDQGRAYRLELHEQAQYVVPGFDPALFYASYGLSDETRKEGAWLRAERAWLDAEEKEMKPVRDSIDAKQATLDQLAASIEKLRPTAGYNDQDRAAVNRLIDERNRLVVAFNAEVNANKGRSAAAKARSDARNARVQPFNERLNRERSTARVALDEGLVAALDAWIDARLLAREQRLRAAVPAGAELETEIALGRWLVGRPAPAPQLRAAPLRPRALAMLHAVALERQLAYAPGYEQRLAMLMEWWQWSGSAGMDAAKRRDFMRDHVKTYARESNVALVRTSLRGLDASDQALAEGWVKEAEEEMKR